MFDLGGIKVDGEGRGGEERGGTRIDENVFLFIPPSPYSFCPNLNKTRRMRKEQIVLFSLLFSLFPLH